MTVRDDQLATLRDVRWFLTEIRRLMAQAKTGDPTAVAYCDAQTQCAIQQIDQRWPGLTYRPPFAQEGDIMLCDDEKSPP